MIREKDVGELSVRLELDSRGMCFPTYKQRRKGLAYPSLDKYNKARKNDVIILSVGMKSARFWHNAQMSRSVLLSTNNSIKDRMHFNIKVQ
jgi:hypothetical protein